MAYAGTLWEWWPARVRTGDKEWTAAAELPFWFEYLPGDDLVYFQFNSVRRGALFVIIGRLTASAAQNTVTAIERETSAIFVGEPTASRPNFIGERIDFELLYSKVQANAADLFWPDAIFAIQEHVPGS